MRLPAATPGSVRDEGGALRPPVGCRNALLDQLLKVDDRLGGGDRALKLAVDPDDKRRRQFQGREGGPEGRGVTSQDEDTARSEGLERTRDLGGSPCRIEGCGDRTDPRAGREGDEELLAVREEERDAVALRNVPGHEGTRERPGLGHELRDRRRPPVLEKDGRAGVAPLEGL